MVKQLPVNRYGVSLHMQESPCSNLTSTSQPLKCNAEPTAEQSYCFIIYGGVVFLCVNRTLYPCFSISLAYTSFIFMLMFSQGK